MLGRSLASHPRRRAITLLELLVVLGILAALFGFSLSAVQRVRLSTLRVERANWHRQRLLGETVARQLPIKVLFIGNSYTSTNDLPGMLLALSRANGDWPELIVETHWVGGATLKKHWDDGIALEKIRSNDWDFVVLQEQSQTPLAHFGRDKLFYPYARRFDKEIREVGAIPLFYMTWARPDTPGPQEWWTKSYVNIARELGAECAPAGIAFEKAKQALPHVKLFSDAGGHPTPEATYLIACTFYAAIYDRAPEGLSHEITTSSGTVTVPPRDAAAMQRLAWEALREVKPRIKPGWR